MDHGFNGAQLAVQSLAGNPLPAASLRVEAGDPSPTAYSPLAPSSLCSSWDVVEQSEGEEERGRPHAGSPVSVYHGGEGGCPAGGAGGSPAALGTLSCLSSAQGQFNGRAQDPRECPVPQPRQPQAVSLGAEGSGGQERRAPGSDAWAAPVGQWLSAASHLRHRQGLSLQQCDRGTALDLSGLTR